MNFAKCQGENSPAHSENERLLRFLSRMTGGEAISGIGMEHSRMRKPALEPPVQG
jgi:hypothetical protein